MPVLTYREQAQQPCAHEQQPGELETGQVDVYSGENIGQKALHHSDC